MKKLLILLLLISPIISYGKEQIITYEVTVFDNYKKLKNPPVKKSIKAQILFKNDKDKKQIIKYLRKQALANNISLNIVPDYNNPKNKMNLQAVGDIKSVDIFLKILNIKKIKVQSLGSPKAQDKN